MVVAIGVVLNLNIAVLTGNEGVNLIEQNRIEMYMSLKSRDVKQGGMCGIARSRNLGA